MIEPCPLAPKLATVERDGATFAVIADGAVVMLLSREQALWFAARLAEKLAERSA